MPAAAPRLDPRLLEELAARANTRLPIAEIARAVGSAADRLGVTRPSYERVRELVHAQRHAMGPGTAGIVLDVAFRARPVGDLGQLVKPAAERSPR